MKTIASRPPPSGLPDLFAAPPSFRPFDRAPAPAPQGLFVPVSYRPFPGRPASPPPAQAGQFWSLAQ